jgi:6-phosphogluconate dehydrogenase
MTEGQAEIGLIGLGVMGSNLALNIAEKGHRIAVFNRTTETTHQFSATAGELAGNIVPCDTIGQLAAAIRPPRPIIIMTVAGPVVDQQIALLRPVLSAGDIIIDAGNANFHDTVRRGQELEGSGLDFVGMGVSGGEEGARHGPSIMVGGQEASYRRMEPVLTAIAAHYKGEPCCAWLGPGGAGHFVKTIHNGIEYADMEMIAEIYGLLRDRHGLGAHEMAPIFERWNKGVLDSYLIEITAAVLSTDDPETGLPIVDVILDKAGQKGTGRWAAIEAEMMGVPATGIESAVAARSLSAMKELREEAARAYGQPPFKTSGPSDEDLKTLELGLFAGKIAAYAQGFEVMAAASAEFSWNTPLDTVARIWRAGCIIRSAFLDTIASAFEQGKAPRNLLLAPEFVTRMKEAAPALRKVVAQAATAGVAAPSLSAALAYFDGIRTARGTANLIQAQRDFFGAHGFERIDSSGAHHGPWSGTES